jgi:hypothetical protein
MELSRDYICGLVEGDGCFTFCNISSVSSGRQKALIPTFEITMNERDMELVRAVRDYLKLSSRVYHLGPYRKDGHKRGAITRLMVRDVGALKNTIVPFFYKRLKGYKGIQFEEWINKIGVNEAVPSRYKIIYRLYKAGFYDQNNRF